MGLQYQYKAEDGNLVLTETLKLWTQAAQIASSCLPVGESSSIRREGGAGCGWEGNVLLLSKHSESRVEKLFLQSDLLEKSQSWVECS